MAIGLRDDVADPLGTELCDQEKQKCDAHHFWLIALNST
jgi:hypothetical protein